MRKTSTSMEANCRPLTLILIVAAGIVMMFLMSDYDWHLLRRRQVAVVEERPSERVIDVKATLMNERHSSTQRFLRSHSLPNATSRHLQTLQ